MLKERDYWLGFSVFSGIGPTKFTKLLNSFGSAKDAWEAPGSHLVKLLGEKLAEKFDRFRNEFSISDYTRILIREGVSFLTQADKGYPGLLSQIKNPPFVLYYKGNKEILRLASLAQDANNSKYLAIVGTRRTTSYGREVTRMFTEELVAAGFTIVSGLAMGIDAVSHKAAVENNGKTVAVLGCGVDCCNPAENLRLYDEIIRTGGVVISELPLGHPPTKGSFPSRNRIIAGLSLGVLVTEGAEDSGALITADYAIKTGRPVFAVPGPITSGMSKGPYKLIQKGAKLVTSAEDILKEFKSQKSKVKMTTQKSKVGNVTKEEQNILKLLKNEPLHFDELVRRTGFDSSKTGSLLSLMEMKGMIKGLDAGMFSLA